MAETAADGSVQSPTGAATTSAHALVPGVGCARRRCRPARRSHIFAKNAADARSTLCAISATRAELDALRRDPDADEFPNEACHRASHDAWVAVRGAAFLKNTPLEHKAAGAFVVSAAEGRRRDAARGVGARRTRAHAGRVLMTKISFR